MASCKITRLSAREYRNGKNPIVLRFVANRKSNIISLNLYATNEEWIEDLRRFSSKTKNYKAKNKILDAFEMKADQILDEIKVLELPLSFEVFESKFTGQNHTTTVYELYATIISELENANKVNTKNIYQTSLNSLKKFTKSKELAFVEINYSFLKKFEAYLFKNGNSGGGVHHHMRTVRAVFNEAIRREFIESRFYPFSTQFNKNGYSLSHLKSKASPRALSEADLKKIKEFNVQENPDLAQSYYYFMFSYYARGINFVDMANLLWSDVYNGRIIYNRSKTSKPINLKISAAMMEILVEFKTEMTTYIFPVLSEIHNTEAQKKNRIKKCLKAYNADLKKIASQLKIGITLTSYVARHTYATTLKRKGLSTEIISEALGHSELATTKAYLEKFSNEIIDEADDLL